MEKTADQLKDVTSGVASSGTLQPGECVQAGRGRGAEWNEQ